MINNVTCVEGTDFVCIMLIHAVKFTFVVDC
jgi:hypothetical protein